MTEDRLEKTCARLQEDAASGGYMLHPDRDFVRELVRGILVNEDRYGYWACPCRLADGDREADLDIICPCDYRDADLSDYGACYCALYVSEEVVKHPQGLGSIPDRRPLPEERKRSGGRRGGRLSGEALAYPVWRCRVCGYLCAREKPPGICPVCKAKQDRFERFA